MTPLRRTGAKGDGEFESDRLGRGGGRDRLAVDATSWPRSAPRRSSATRTSARWACSTPSARCRRCSTGWARPVSSGRSAGRRASPSPRLTRYPWSDPENLPDARTVVVWGMDPVATSIHTWELIRKARRNGARLVVVDPYRSRTAAYADVHVRPHAGTDGALALALGHVIVRDGLEDDEFVTSRTSDVDDYRAAVEPWTPERAATETGVAAETIVELAHLVATARPTAFRIGVGMQRAAGAGSALRAIQCLTAVTGQWRWPAGGISQAVSIGQLDLGERLATRPVSGRHPGGQHDPARSCADRSCPRPADPQPVRVEQQPGRDRGRPAAGARAACAGTTSSPWFTTSSSPTPPASPTWSSRLRR